MLYCDEWVPALGITNADTIVFVVLGGSGSGGVAIYTGDGSTRLFSTGGITFSGDVKTVTSSAFTLDPGTQYQVCRCAATGIGWMASRAGVNGVIAQMENALSVPGTTSAANPCLGGSPPITTGVLSAHDHAGPLIFLLGTTTP